MKIFLAPRSGEKSYENFKSTIKNGIPLERISNFLSKSDIETLSNEEVIYAWGNRKGTYPAWNNMENGSMVIFYANRKLVMSGEVYLKKHSPEMALAMWPPDENGNPWEYTFFIKNLKYFSMPISAYNAVVNFKPNFIVQGFMEAKKDHIDKINKTYGSVEKMLEQFTDSNSEEIPLEDDELYVNIPTKVTPTIIEDISLRPTTEKEFVIPKKQNKEKINYQKRNIKNAITGSRGEQLVCNQEIERLKTLSRPDLAKRVERVSLKHDNLGYDIASFESDGTARLIEVKTISEERSKIRFFMSANEYKVAEKTHNYYIYIVENIDSNSPLITLIKNPIDKSKFNIQTDTYIFEAIKEK